MKSFDMLRYVAAAMISFSDHQLEWYERLNGFIRRQELLASHHFGRNDHHTSQNYPAYCFR